MAARCEAIPDGLVRAFPVRSLLWKWRVRRLAAQSRSHEALSQTDAAFASAVARLKLPPHEVFFGYSYASLETLEAEKKRGVLTVLDQIDPGAAEFRLVAEEMARFPELAGPPPDFPAAYYERNRREWELADRIIVNSRWSFDALVNQGVPPGKLVVVPLCFEKKTEVLKPETLKAESGRQFRHLTPALSPDEVERERLEGRSQQSVVCSQSEKADKWKSEIGNRKSEMPLRFLFLGQVNVRKGIHYLMAAARLLERENVRFDVVGPVGILPGALASAPGNMTFHGPVSRDCAEQWYGHSDVFVLPTLSDGFALTQIEAMAHGLPVIATPNCGEVVSDGVDGFIVPTRDAAALAGAIGRYLAEPGLLERQSNAAVKKSGQFTLDKLGEQLKVVEQNLRGGVSSR